METKKRRRYSENDRVQILRLHFSEGTSIRELCRHNNIHPTILYRWKRELLSRLDTPTKVPLSRARALQLRRRIKSLDSRIERLNKDVASVKQQLKELTGTFVEQPNAATRSQPDHEV